MSEQKFEEIVVSIAYNAIKNCLSSSYEFDVEALIEDYPKLKEEQATFVTLTLDGNLRGCIGTLTASRPLIEDIIYNAKAAAFNDPRFAPLNEAEFEHVDIEVSLLSASKALAYVDEEDLKSKIKPGEDGVVLKYHNNQATFLPQVWEQLPSFELFFEHLCLKAGLEEGCLVNKPEIYIYSVRKIK